MPSKSIAQLRLMRMALAYKKGKMGDRDVSDAVKDIANSMTVKQLEDYAKSPSKKLPYHIQEDFATLGSTPGMGDVTPPTATTSGSGDVFNAYGLYTQGFLKKAKKDRKSKKTDPLKHYQPEKGVAHFQPHGTILHFQDFIKNLQNKDVDQFSDHNDDSSGMINTETPYNRPQETDGGYDDSGE
jgi:hypothetical protein